MKDRSDRAGKPNRHSEVLNGKRPAADARLLHDILGAEDKITVAQKIKNTTKPAAPRKRHDAHIEAKNTHQPGVTQWD